MGLDPERLNVFVKSLRRHSPATRLVVFVEENTKHQLLEDNGAEVIPFKMREDEALVLYRCVCVCVWGGGAGGAADCWHLPPPVAHHLASSH
jgi:hypothetical protein